MMIQKHLPNTFTILNLLAGSIGISAVFNGRIHNAALLILLGGVFDFLDGFFARLFNVRSDLGKELDSLADIITFGLLPAFLYYHLLGEMSGGYYPYFALLIVVASAFRLAKFNIDTGQNDHFIGLPTPANAFLTAGLVFVYLQQWESLAFLFSDPNILAVLVVIQSFLLNARMPFFSMKFKNAGWKGNEFRYITIGASILLLLFFRLPGIFIAFLIYFLLSIIAWIRGKTLSDA